MYLFLMHKKAACRNRQLSVFYVRNNGLNNACDDFLIFLVKINMDGVSI